MFLHKSDDPKKLTVDDLIDSTVAQMDDEQDSTTEEYTLMAKNLKTLYEAKSYDRPDFVSKEAWLAAGSNLVGMLLVLNHERLYPIASKAFSMLKVMK